MDKDGSGQIDKDEMVAVVKEMMGEGVGEGVLYDLEWDANLLCPQLIQSKSQGVALNVLISLIT